MSIYRVSIYRVSIKEERSSQFSITFGWNLRTWIKVHPGSMSLVSSKLLITSV